MPLILEEPKLPGFPLRRPFLFYVGGYDERKNIPAFLATETMPDLTLGRYEERRCFFVVKRTRGFEINPGFVQF